MQACIPALYDAVAKQIRSLVDSDLSDINLTFTLTQDLSPVTMLSVMAQCLDEYFNMEGTLVHAQQCTDSHTVKAICKALVNMLLQWNITKVHILLRDSAHNILAMEECLGCMAHTL